MPYTAEISRANPTCFLFLIDQSESMKNNIGGGDKPMQKAEAVADAVNRLLSELSIKCAKEDGVRNYFHVGVLGYGASVSPLFEGELAGRDLVPLSDVAAHPARLEERSRSLPASVGGDLPAAGPGRKVMFPTWFSPVAYGDTPMCGAFTRARSVLEGWLADHPRSFPPIVVNITDGESTDGDAAPVAQSLQSLTSADGAVLLFNLHLSADKNEPIIFPAEETNLPDDFARRLHRMSSVLPAQMREAANRQGLMLDEQARGFAFNADISAIVQFLDVGTQVLELT
ncbi:MAG TPA: vWA domain-containing protein [Acidimicrobiales bacterium]|nr:vWA domain-containing protein [Acidimicrobiales bacterium]